MAMFMIVLILLIPSAELAETVAVPLQQPLARSPTLAAQQFGPAAGRANTGITLCWRAGRGADPPAGQASADAQAGIAPTASRMQQQGRDARGLRRQLQAPALPQPEAPHLAHHHGQAGTFQPLLHGPQALLVIPPMDQEQLPRSQAKGGKARPVQSPARRTPQHPAAIRAILVTGRDGPPGRQHRREGQGRATLVNVLVSVLLNVLGRVPPVILAVATQHLMQTAPGQAAARQAAVDPRHAQS